jgi:hypothetical protein
MSKNSDSINENEEKASKENVKNEKPERSRSRR